jgi:hypothetical protein
VGPRSESPSPEFRAPKLVQARALSPLGCFAGQGRSDAAVPPWFMVHARGMDRGGRGGGIGPGYARRAFHPTIRPTFPSRGRDGHLSLARRPGKARQVDSSTPYRLTPLPAAALHLPFPRPAGPPVPHWETPVTEYKGCLPLAAFPSSGTPAGFFPSPHPTALYSLSPSLSLSLMCTL